jgi:hypothetical protein
LKTALVMAALGLAACCLGGSALILLGALSGDSSSGSGSSEHPQNPTRVDEAQDALPETATPAPRGLAGRWIPQGNVGCPEVSVEQVMAAADAPKGQKLPPGCGGFLELHSDGTCRYLALYGLSHACAVRGGIYSTGYDFSDLNSSIGRNGSCAWTTQDEKTTVLFNGFQRLNECYKDLSDESDVFKVEGPVVLEGDRLTFRNMHFRRE